MEALSTAILGFAAYHNENPLPPDAPTRQYLTALRSYLDATVPRWRERAFESSRGSKALAIELRLNSGRVVQGALLQRPSRVRKGKPG